jgi:hypothetical protein
MIIEELKSNLTCYQDPYFNIDSRYIDYGYPHTNINESFIENVLNYHNPTFWLEVGSMTGGSAIKTANVIKRKNMNTNIVCIDPFVGDVNMWDWEHNLHAKNEWRFLNLEEGFPTIRKRFLANVKDSNNHDIIFPIPTTGLVGMKLLLRLYKQKRISERPQVIYLDAAHEQGETYLEIKTAWELLAPGGVLIGDDWDWEAVRNDATIFSKEIGKEPVVEGSGRGNAHWLMIKE